MRNPFGPSAVWVAVEHEAVVGFRTFLRWQFEHPDGRTRHAVRAVDAATSAADRRQGIFRRLTLTAVDELIAEGVDFVFNTPNRESMAGNLALGWATVGRVPITAHVRGLASARRLRRSRVPAELWPVSTNAGTVASDVLADPSVYTTCSRPSAHPPVCVRPGRPSSCAGATGSTRWATAPSRSTTIPRRESPSFECGGGARRSKRAYRM